MSEDSKIPIVFTTDVWLRIARLWFVNRYSIFDISKELNIDIEELRQIIELLTEIKKLVKESIVNDVITVLHR